MKTHGVKVDLNYVDNGGNSRIDDRSGTLGARCTGCWLRSTALVTLALSLTGCGLLGGGDRDRDDYDGRIYVGAGALVSNIEPDTDDVPGVSVDESSSAGGSFAIGYDLSPRLSIEGHIAELGEAELAPTGTVGYQVGGISAIAYGLADEGSRARREGFSVFGRLGLGSMRNQAEDVPFERLNDFHLLAGLGVEYGLEMGLGIRAELVAHDTDAQYGQLGLVYRFGESGRRQNGSRNKSFDSADSGDSTNAVPVPAPSNSRISVDSDADGVADPVDLCADTVSGRPVDNTGCDVFDGVIEGVNFKSGSDALTAEAQSVLDSIAGTLRDYPDVVISIEAHTDNQGSASSNLELSKKRALSVARYLVTQGVSGQRLRPKAFGESKPRASNATAAGRSQNRRVEFNIVE